ncbi:MAG: SDR family NAD(P)-dependent oxidoreductase [Gammaproteobacteria bacterium]|nr:SDR family NAD(P)-dependent oxidoreductase [Gammaproteobacteria bacterium]MBT3870733.1 SDR family NAD(P)-dependent oxidoreductase [Gammaproteobacteria bacterium]MBT5196051.1 SDR family NAD(P)-dependent oxidoreductase [Gammaproteobacteria bacterium]MBT5444896.1 SDR family NAD(P)-dependent oxidoreductase [Gammaproteobacteria bacterium]MBT5790185.1 SDR family NAD(P)-dependent oxidoreductase [Gammaproteobacteria bacterium]
MSDLKGQIAVVTGSSRGIGKGIALALAEQGCTVYATGRTIGDGDRTIDTTARQVTEAGGEGHAIRCDHGDDDDIARLFEQIGQEAGRIDILVNNVYKIPSPPAWGGGYWDHPISIWDDQVGIGLRAHYVASWHAAGLMFESDNARMLNVSSPGGQSYHFSSSYGAGKAGLDRLTADMAVELEPKGIPACVLYPGSVSTEFIQDAAEEQGMDLSQSQTPLLVGRAATSLLMSDDMMPRTGSIQWVEDLITEFDLFDENGSRPTTKYAQRNS